MRSAEEARIIKAQQYQVNRLKPGFLEMRRIYKRQWEKTHTARLWEPRRLAGKRTYQNCKEKIKVRSAARYKAGRDRVKEYLQSHPCVDCGFSDTRSLDFDHVRGVKLFTIGKKLCLNWDKIAAEIEKCEVRCANCHRIRHCAD